MVTDMDFNSNKVEENFQIGCLRYLISKEGDEVLLMRRFRPRVNDFTVYADTSICSLTLDYC